MKLNPKVQKALQQIDFVKRYEKLSQKYDDIKTPLSERLIYIDGETVIDIVKDLGYDIQFNGKDKFFYIDEKVENFKFSFRFILDEGMMDFIFAVWENVELLVGDPWGVYSRRMINLDYRIKKPKYSDYDDLEEILKVGCEIYNDFKNCIVDL